MSRTILTTAMLACLGGAAFAADPAPAPKAEHETVAAVNKLDPVSGKEIDAKIKTITVKYQGHAVVIGFSSQDDAEVVAKAEHKVKELYAQAAKEGKLVKDGKLVDAPKAEKADAAK